MTIDEVEPRSQSIEAETTTNRGFVALLAGSMERFASLRVWLTIVAAWMVFATVLFASSAPFAIPEVESACGQAPLDVRFFSSGADVASFLDVCGEAGRTAYRNLQLADLFYPLLFGLFMASSLAVIIRRLAPTNRSLVAVAGLGFVGSAFDYLENLFAWNALAAYPDDASTNWLLGIASAAKTLSSWIAGIVLLVLLVVFVVHRGRGRAVARIARRPTPGRHREDTSAVPEASR